MNSIDFSTLKNKISLPESWKKADTWAMLARRLIYIACFAWLIYLDHIIGSADGWTQATLKQYTSVIFAIICLTAYKAKDFLKIPYLVWVVLFFILRPFVIDWAWENHYLVAGVYPVSRFEVYVWNVGIYGILFIRMFYAYAIEKVKPRMNWPIFAVWLAMMLGMVLSVNDDIWFYSFLLMFGCFYLTNFSQKQLNALFTGMVEGIILGFIIIQWLACLYRPFDEVGYKGMYANCNINALFYTVSYMAVLGKWYLMKLKRRPFIMIVPMILLGGALWSLTIFTGCRTALISMMSSTMLFIVFQVISRKKWKILELIKNAALILAIIILVFEPTYNLVRYVPAYTNNPIYFVGEYTRWKIHVDDAFDAERYVEYDEMMEYTFGRVSQLRDWLPNIWGKVGNIILPVIKVNASENAEVASENQIPVELRGTESYFPMADIATVSNDTFEIRKVIYEYYWNKLNFEGHTVDEHGVWVTEVYHAPHPHNIFLQITFDHGYIVGILFILMILLTLFKVVKGMIQYKQGAWYYRLFVISGIITIIVTFGMFEMCWVYGQIIFTLLFMAFRLACHNDEPT